MYEKDKEEIVGKLQEWAGPLLVGRTVQKEAINRSIDKDAKGPLSVLFLIHSPHPDSISIGYSPRDSKTTRVIFPILDI